MRQFLETFFAVAVLVLTEAWFLKGYFSGQLDFESGVAFLVALSVVILKEPIKATISNKRRASRSNDHALFQDFLHALPTDPTIRLLKDHDFGNSFLKKSIEPLHQFTATWDSVEKEFLDATLEREKKALFSLARELAREIASRTVLVGGADYLSVVSDRMRATDQSRPLHVIEDARIFDLPPTSRTNLK